MPLAGVGAGMGLNSSTAIKTRKSESLNTAGTAGKYPLTCIWMTKPYSQGGYLFRL